MYIIKQTLLFIILVLLGCYKVNSQVSSIRVGYSISIDTTYFKKNIRNTKHNEIKNTIENLNFWLEADKKVSLFEVESSLAKEDNKIYQIALAQVGGNFKYYKDKNAKIISGRALDEVITIIEDQEKFKNWHITKKSQKNILGYNCLKATTEIELLNKDGEYTMFPIEVWFAPELPFNTGPVGIDNLPGLVLKGFVNRNFIFNANSIQIEPADLNIKKPRTDIVLSKEEFSVKVIEVLEMIKKRGSDSN